MNFLFIMKILRKYDISSPPIRYNIIITKRFGKQSDRVVIAKKLLIGNQCWFERMLSKICQMQGASEIWNLILQMLAQLNQLDTI